MYFAFNYYEWTANTFREWLTHNFTVPISLIAQIIGRYNSNYFHLNGTRLNKFIHEKEKNYQVIIYCYRSFWLLNVSSKTIWWIDRSKDDFHLELIKSKSRMETNHRNECTPFLIFNLKSISNLHRRFGESV